MKELYNTQSTLSSNLSNYFKKVHPSLSKPHLKLIPPIIIGMINSESVVTSDIVKNLRDDFSLVLPSSSTRRLERFFNNPFFDIYSLFESIIRDVISSYKLKNKKVYISFDHMYCRNSFTVFLISLRIGKQGIPLWFRCFKGKQDPDAFKVSLFTQGIQFVYDIFSSKNCKLIFLADRWFPICQLMHFIDSIGAVYYIRAKSNTIISIDNYPDSDMIHSISDIPISNFKSSLFDSVFITSNRFHTKLAISPALSHSDPFIILTNGNTKDALKNYGYRFGSIETIFKNQKSNGFYLESSKVRNIHAFETLFGLMCIALLWLTIIGVDYSKNKNHFNNHFKLKISKKNGSARKRILSLFNTGLTLFRMAFNSYTYFNLKCTFILYDI